MTQEVWNKIINSEMLLIGIGTQLSVKEDNEKQINLDLDKMPDQQALFPAQQASF